MLSFWLEIYYRNYQTLVPEKIDKGICQEIFPHVHHL